MTDNDKNYDKMYNLLSLATKNKEILHQIDWPSRSIFDKSDKDRMETNLVLDLTNAADLINIGTTKEQAEQTGKGMWYIKNAQTSADGMEHKASYFDNLYPKISCCMGGVRSNVTVPLIFADKDDTHKIKHIGVMKNARKTPQNNCPECIIDGVDWYDDNYSQECYNQNCEKLFTRLLAFLDKHNPKSPLITKYGGCLHNKFLKQGNLDFTKGTLGQLAKVSRKCVIDECSNTYAFKPLKERESCELTFCEANIDYGDLDIDEWAVISNKIELNCGKKGTRDDSNDSNNPNNPNNPNYEEEEEDKDNYFNKLLLGFFVFGIVLILILVAL